MSITIRALRELCMNDAVENICIVDSSIDPEEIAFEGTYATVPAQYLDRPIDSWSGDVIYF